MKTPFSILLGYFVLSALNLFKLSGESQTSAGFPKLVWSSPGVSLKNGVLNKGLCSEFSLESLSFRSKAVHRKFLGSSRFENSVIEENPESVNSAWWSHFQECTNQLSWAKILFKIKNETLYTNAIKSEENSSFLLVLAELCVFRSILSICSIRNYKTVQRWFSLQLLLMKQFQTGC